MSHVFKAALTAALPFLFVARPGSAPTAAPAKIAGTFTAKYVEQHQLPVADAEGHTLLTGKSEGTNRSTGPTPYMEQGKVTSVEFGDLVQGNGPHEGYIVFSQGADSMISRWNGKVTTKLSPDKTPMISFAGNWTKLRGTGKYEGVTGKGTYNGHFTSQTEYTCDWSGEISGRLATN